MYALDGLRLESPWDDSPCAWETRGRISRWRRCNLGCISAASRLYLPRADRALCFARVSDVCGPSEVDETTVSSVLWALGNSTDSNEYIRDVEVDGDCSHEVENGVSSAANTHLRIGRFISGAMHHLLIGRLTYRAWVMNPLPFGCESTDRWTVSRPSA